MVSLSGYYQALIILLLVSKEQACEGDETAWIVDLSCEQSDEMFARHAEKMNFEIVDERPNISIFDSARMGIEGDASEDAAIGHIHLSDLR